MAPIDSGAAEARSPNDPRTNVNLVWKSSGCGKPLPANQMPTVPGLRTGYTEYHVHQTGATLAATDPTKAADRLFWVRVPADYNPSRAYRVVYLLQGCGGGNGRDNVYPLFDEKQGGSEQAIYVAVALPPNMPNGACYDNRAGTSSQEWEAFQLMHDVVEANYCADNNRIFVAGYSSGAWVANMWGCYFAGIPSPPRKFAPSYSIRGRAGVAGALPAVPPCNGPVAAFSIYDPSSGEGSVAGSYAARDLTLKMNGCSNSATSPWPGKPDVCVQYVDCPKQYPVVFCTTQGLGHSDESSIAIPSFTKFFDSMN
jgi:poly(3-hydroxybutyrate) depolymerase